MIQGGDKGQRYEVRAVGMQGREFVVGWSDRSDGGAAAEIVAKHPVWVLSRIIDRQEGGAPKAKRQ